MSDLYERCQKFYQQMLRANSPVHALADFVAAENASASDPARARLIAALEDISALTAGGPHLSAQAGMTAALNALDDARSTARAALAAATGGKGE
jgi:hypothetical protein